MKLKIQIIALVLFAACFALVGCTTTTISVKDGAKMSTYSRTAVGTNQGVGSIDANLTDGKIKIENLSTDQTTGSGQLLQLILAIARAVPAGGGLPVPGPGLVAASVTTTTPASVIQTTTTVPSVK